MDKAFVGKKTRHCGEGSAMIGGSGAEAVASAHPVIGGGGGSGSDGDEKKMFFTTTDLIEKMNAAVRDGDVPPSDTGGFELQRKLPDGTYRRAEESEMAAADFQAKMKQASEMIKNLNGEQKIEWATHQRREGNALFARGEYQEAMDVYLTCLVAMDQPSSASTEEDTPADVDAQIETEIKLPVLLNLALSAMKLGTPSKAEKFCNFAMETEAGKRSVKAHFRRGKVRMLMGHYVSAELDLDKALDLVAEKSKTEGCDLSEADDERRAILREKQKLTRLVNQAEKNRRQQKRAMEKLFKSEENDDRTLGGLYSEKKDMPTTRHEDHDTYEHVDLSYFQWYKRMVGRCAQKLLDIIGHEDAGEFQDVAVDQDLLNSLMDEKKNA